MVQVTEMGYMGLGVKNLDEWKDFATRHSRHGARR